MGISKGDKSNTFNVHCEIIIHEEGLVPTRKSLEMLFANIIPLLIPCKVLVKSKRCHPNKSED